MKRMLKRGALLAGLSTIFPVGYLVSFNAGWVISFPDWGDYLWPTAIFLMATDGRESDISFVSQVAAISILANAIIWFGVGLFGLWLFESVRSKVS